MSGADDNPAGSGRTPPANGRYLVGVSLLVLIAISALGKAVNQFGFFVYPDSYYYLLIAENLLRNGHPAGTLGAGGMSFPPLGYAALKTTYPLAVGMGMLAGLSSASAGHLVAAIAAVGCVPVAFWATQRMSASRASALAAATLVATSYGITYWAGFILSDTLSVLLAFWLLGLVAAERRDEWANRGDLITGLALALLILSRPTYIVVVPFVAWMAVRRFGWTRTRLMSAAAAALLPLSTAVMFWFPPFSFGSRLLGNVAPVLAGAFAVAALAALSVWFLRSADPKRKASLGRMVPVVLAVAFLGVLAFARFDLLVGGNSPYPGFARFAARDPAVLLCLLPGTIVLIRRRRGDVAAALLFGAALLLGVYYWAEPRESRYLIQALPFLVPVASAAGMLAVSGTRTRLLSKPGGGAAPLWACVATVVFLAVALGTVCYQGYRSSTRASASFLRTSYPREVAARLETAVPEDATVITALPWPYYFHLRRPTWGAGVVFADPAKQLGEDAKLLVICDASLRFHYPRLAKRLERSFEQSAVAEFDLPMSYQYGYSAFADPSPVRAYAVGLADLTATMSGSRVPTLGPPAQEYEIVRPPSLVVTRQP